MACQQSSTAQGNQDSIAVDSMACQQLQDLQNPYDSQTEECDGRFSSELQSKSSGYLGHVETRGVKKSVDSMACQQSSTAQGNQDSIAVFTTAITQAWSDIKKTMRSGFAGLGHQIQA